MARDFNPESISDPNSIFRSWQAPPAAAPEDRKLGWLNEHAEDGNSFNKAQRGTSDWQRALDIISGRTDVKVPEYRNNMNTNLLKRNVKEVVGTLAKLRPQWGYNSDNSAYAKSAHMMNLTTKALYLEGFFDLKIKEALQYAAATCTGWVRPIYMREMAGTSRGKIKLLSYGAPCVLPTQLPSSGDFQEAYAVTLLDEMPIYMAHSMFPNYQDKLHPTSSMYWYSSEIRESSKGNLWQRMWSLGRSAGAKASTMANWMIPVRYTYVIDLTVNRTGMTIPMGEPGTSWYYEVPSVGDKLSDGRIATVNDARLYPLRRLLISSEACVMYDGPSFDLHGRLPLIPFATDRWPWEPLGFSMCREGYDIQIAVNTLWRGIVDKCVAQNDMALGYDINSMSLKQAKEFDPMQPRARMGFDSSMASEPFKPIVPPEVMAIKPEMFTALESLDNTLMKQMGVNDALALAKARMAGDDMERILESTGPIIEDMSRSMEPPMRELGEQTKYLTLQYLDVPRVMQYVGPDNISLEVFDYDPTSLVPSHLPGEDPGTAAAPRASSLSRPQRARIVGDNLRYFITPYSIHELTQMAFKLGLIQLKKAEVMIDSQTIAEAWNVPNYGTIDGATVMDKWESEQEKKLTFAMKMAVLQASLQAGDSGGGPDVMGAVNAVMTPPQPEGRPPSGQHSPELKQKPNGRTIITESQGGGRTV